MKSWGVPDKQPNIVFFFWDNLGWGELGCYHTRGDRGKGDKTPH